MRPFLMEGVRWAFKSEAWKPTKQEWLKGLSCVQSEEKERVQKFVFKKDVKSSLIGRLLLRKVITEMLNIPYDEINLGRTEKGKPFLVNEIENSRGKSFSFNVSHQGDYTVLAAEPHRQVGVDIMKTTYPGGTDVPGFFHIMRKQFTPHEWTTVKNLSNEWEQLQMFYRFWCLKESYVKAVGVGIGHDLQATEFRIKTQELSRELRMIRHINIDTTQTKNFILKRMTCGLKWDNITAKSITCDSCLHLNGSRNKEWSFEEIKLDNLHQVAVALGPLSTDGETMSSQRSSPIPFKFLSFDEVISSATPLRPVEEESWESFKTKRENPAR